jgi:ribonuclease-3
MNSRLEDLEQTLGYSFQDRALLRRALTHSSSANEAGEAASADNERLEFLGDAVLGWIVSEWLFESFRGFTEGQLSLVKNHVVSAAHLLAAAQRLDLGEYLHLGRGEETAGGRGKQRLLVNAFEAVLAAVYLDGGAERARELVFRFVIPAEAEAEQLAGAGPPHDYRAELERLVRERDLPKPTYTLASESGPGHARVFAVEARVGKELVVMAEGPSKKAASHKAAKALCERLRETDAI